jgi:FkbM family methyltransferase
MIDPFANRLISGSTIGEVILPTLTDNGGDVIIVDVGARNSMEWPATLAPYTRFIGFEPNQEEYEKLVSHSTDAQKLGITTKKFGKEEFYNCAVWSSEKNLPFYITQGTGSCTMMGHSNQAVTSKMWLEESTDSYDEQYAKVIESKPVSCKPLDDLLSDHEIIDFLKIDVEGAEMEVLKGAEALFLDKKILFVKSEFFLVPLFKENKLLGHQHVYLHDHGFRMIGMELDKNAYMHGVRSNIPAMADTRLIYGGDAYFILDPDMNKLGPDVILRMGIIALSLGFRSLAISLLNDSHLVSDYDLISIEKALHKLPLKKRLKYVWQTLPDKILSIIRR